MDTNAKLIAVALFLATVAPSQSNAQNQASLSDSPHPPASMGSDGPPSAGPGKGRRKHDVRPGNGDDEQGPGRKGARGLTSLTTVSGTVGQWTGNDDSILDGFTLNAGSGVATTVKFPPHLGQQVQKAVKPGSSISVSGYSETGAKGDTRFHMTSLTAGKTTVFDTPPTPKSTTPDEPALTTVNGKIVDYRLNRDGRVSGLVLDDKTIVTIPPHTAYQLTDLAKKGSTITVQGYPKSLHDGQVQLEKINILRASVLTINGQQYLVR